MPKQNLESLMIKVNRFTTHSKVGNLESVENKMKNLNLESDVCERMWCPKTRRFELHVVDSSNQVCEGGKNPQKNFI